MDDSVDILTKTSVEFEKLCNGLSGGFSLSASIVGAWREKYAACEAKCEELSNKLKEKEADNVHKDEVIANKDQQIFELQNKVHELESRPTCLGDNVNTKINNTYIYGQDRTDATRSVAGVM